MKTWYTSDWHLFHKNIIRYSNRPFASVDEMNQAIIDRTNERVGRGDRLYIIGDVAFARVEKVLPLLEQLVCEEVHLVAGNHDSPEVRRMRRADQSFFWRSVSDFKEINDDGRKVVLCHYALRVWNRSHHGAYHLYGHSHGSMPGNSQSLDAGVDCWDYYPITLDQAVERMQTLTPFKSGDHHE